MLISIILPTYNVGKYIGRALRSCRNQSYPNIEIVVVDDRGSDNSIEQAAAIASTDTRIRILTNSRNLGTFHARHEGVKAASGEYVVFLDPDDALHETTCATLAEVAKDGSADVLFFGRVSLQATSAEDRVIRYFKVPAVGHDLHSFFAGRNPRELGTPGKAYKRRVVLEAYALLNIPLNQRLVYGEDVLLLYAVLLIAKSGVSLNTPLYHYYLNDTSISSQRSIESIRFQQGQLALVIKLIEEACAQNCGPQNICLEKIARNFCNRLRSDSWMIARNTTNERGEKRYFSSVLAAFLETFSVIEFLHLALYLATLGRVRR